MNLDLSGDASVTVIGVIVIEIVIATTTDDEIGTTIVSVTSAPVGMNFLLSENEKTRMKRVRSVSIAMGNRVQEGMTLFSNYLLSPELSPEERDARTVFVWQLSARIRQRDLEDFFSSVGKIRDVRLIIDGKTKRSKGIAYVEFREVESAQLALGLTGTKLLGVPIQIQQSHAEKNRAANAGGSAMAAAYGRPVSSRGPMKLYVGSLHFNITEEMLRGIFEPFGKLDDIKLIKDPQTNRSQGYGFVTYSNGDDARKALDQLNGFDLAGRAMKVCSLILILAPPR